MSPRDYKLILFTGLFIWVLVTIHSLYSLYSKDHYPSTNLSLPTFETPNSTSPNSTSITKLYTDIAKQLIVANNNWFDFALDTLKFLVLAFISPTVLILFHKWITHQSDELGRARAEHQRDLELQHEENRCNRDLKREELMHKSDELGRVRADQQRELELNHEQMRCERELRREELAEARDKRNAETKIRTIEREARVDAGVQTDLEAPAADQITVPMAPANDLGEMLDDSNSLADQMALTSNYM